MDNWEVVVLSSEQESECPFYRFNMWEMASSFIEFQLSNGYSCLVNKVEMIQD